MSRDEPYVVVMRVVSAAVRCGWLWPEIEPMFGPDTALGRHVADDGRHSASKARFAYQKACAWEAAQVEQIAVCMEAADAIGYGASRTARQCLLGLLRVWHQAGNPIGRSDGLPTVDCSLRTLSEMVGSPVPTILRATNCLNERGLLSSTVDRKKARSASRRSERLAVLTTRWTLRVHNADNNSPFSRERLSDPYVGSAVVHGHETRHASSGVALHPAWCEKGLGSNAQRVYGALCAVDRATVKQLADATRLHRNTISRRDGGALQRLQMHGLCDRKDDGSWIAADGDLDEIAEFFGVADRARELRARHDADRQTYADWFARTEPL